MALQLHKDFAPVPLSGDEEKLSISALGLFVVTILLLAFGLTMLYSASYTTSGISFFKKQLIWIMGGITGGSFLFIIGYRRVCSCKELLLFLCWGLLIAALFFEPVKGARRWIRFALPLLGEVSLQPSELTKLALCIFTAGYCASFSRSFYRLRHPQGRLIPGAMILITGSLIWAGKDMGTTLLVLTTAGAILLAAGLPLRYALVGGGAALLYFGAKVLTNPERLSRVVIIADPAKDGLGEGYQLYRSLIALGSGGWLGLGLGESRLKNDYLPEPHTDFILSVVGEELGIIALWLVILLYLLWGFFAMRIAVRAHSKLGMLLAFGLTIAVQLQALINLAVVSGSIPTKGMPAPFISYGGSNVMCSILAVSLLLSVAMETLRPGYSDAILESFKRKFRKNK